MDIPLSGKQVRDIVKNKSNQDINIIPFSNIPNYDNIDELFGDKNCILLIYLSEPKFGHWCSLIRIENNNKDKKIIYFNPTGRNVDESIDFISDEFKKQSNQDYPHILKLLHDSDYNVAYMNTPLQEANTNSCGRWCALFMNKRKILEDFYDIIENPEDLFADVYKKYTNDDIINEVPII